MNARKPDNHSKPDRVAVIGAGIIGLATTLELAKRGTGVTLFDRHWPPRGASWAAAGMLAPAFEAAGDVNVHPRLYELCQKSAAMWPAWAEELESATRLDSGYRPGPSLAVATTVKDKDRLAKIAKELAGTSNAPLQVSPEDLAKVEPDLANVTLAAYLLVSDGQVDNRETMRSLVKLAEQHPAITIVEGEPELQARNGKLDHAGHDATLVCAGWGTSIVKVMENGERISLLNWDTVLDEIDCYAGQMLSVEPVLGGPTRTIRAGSLYIVPKSDRIVIGATTHPDEIIETPDPEVISQLKAQAAALFPALAQARTLESWAGVRPGTRNHAPLLGETATPGLFVASGHYRNGILLAPLTAKIMADLIVDGETCELAAAFAPHCFA